MSKPPLPHDDLAVLQFRSIGIKAEGEGAWLAKKHGPSRARQCRRVHSGIDADRLVIRAIEITVSRVGGPAMHPEVLTQIPADLPIGKVSAPLARFKGKLRDFDRQVAELRIRAAILNRFTALGTPQTRRVG